MHHAAAAASVFVIISVLVIISGCTFVLPESQNVPLNVTQTSTSNANITVSVQPLGERQRYTLNPVISYTAKDGYTLALYEINVTNHDGVVRAGDTAFFTLVGDNGTMHTAVLTGFTPRTLGSGESLSGTVVFEIPQSAVSREVQYSDGMNRVTISV